MRNLDVLRYFCNNPWRGDAAHRAVAAPSIAIHTTSALISRREQWRCSDVGAGSDVTCKLGVTVEQSLEDKRLSADMARFLFPLVYLLLAACSHPHVGLCLRSTTSMRGTCFSILGWVSGSFDWRFPRGSSRFERHILRWHLQVSHHRFLSNSYTFEHISTIGVFNLQ